MGSKIRIQGMNGLAGRVFERFMRGWMSTLRYEVAYANKSLDPVLGIGGPRIYVVWHEHLLAPIHLRPDANIAILVSKHRDADVLEAIAAASGLECVRGSTGRGGVAALRQLAERGKDRHLVMTPDGPRGPRRRLAAGPVFLASKLGLPIVPIAVAYDRCWRTPTWDKFAIPRPFTTARMLLGDELPVAANLDRTGIEARREEIQAECLRLTEEAEAWASTERIARPTERGRRERPGDRSHEMPGTTRLAA